MDMSTRRIVILGKTGAGKSSLANTIFGEELFHIGHTVSSDTKKCKAETRPVNGRNITLIDTPGFFDTHRSEKEVKSEILRSIIECAPGPHAFIILIKVERYTEQEHAVISKINQSFSEEVFKYATVLFTHGDQLPEGKTIKDFAHDNDLLRDLVKKCGGRCHVVDNKYWKNNQQEEYRSNQFQVKELLNTTDEMVKANEGRCYTNEMLQEVEEKIKEEMQRIRQSAGNKSEEEIREEAKESTFGWFWIKLTAITTGALWGGFLGLAGMMREVITALPQTGGRAGMSDITERAGDAAVRGAMHDAAEGTDTASAAASAAASNTASNTCCLACCPACCLACCLACCGIGSSRRFHDETLLVSEAHDNTARD